MHKNIPPNLRFMKLFAIIETYFLLYAELIIALGG